MGDLLTFLLVAGVVVVVWMVLVAHRRRMATEHLLAYAREEREGFKESTEAGGSAEWAVHMISNASDELGHDMREKDLVTLGLMIKHIIDRSNISPDAFIENINQLENRVKRGLVIDVKAERRVISEFVGTLSAWREKAEELLKVLIPLFPKSEDEEDRTDGDGRLTVTTSLIERATEPYMTVARACLHMRHLDGSGYDGEKLPDVEAVKLKRGRIEELIIKFLGGTPVEQLLLNTDITTEVRIPAAVRFEHTMILAGSGHGKTQTLQRLLVQDLEEVQAGKASLVVIDSQGDLISNIAHLEMFAPNHSNGLAERLLLIDPNHVEHPPALNLFDINMERINSYGAAEREKIMNGTVELYNYIFGALLGAEMTQKQSVIFTFLGRLMLAIPDATIETLRDVMENGDAYRPYMDRLDGTARSFFETQFFDKSFADTKKQILRRLWGVLGNPAFERMFSNRRNKVDMFHAINSGSVVLVNTAKDFLQQEWCEIFGRFFIALVAQAAIQRAAIPESKRLKTYLYIDEASDYFDDHVELLLNSARKYRVGVTIANQNLTQMETGIRATVMASTSTKLAGGTSAKDARAMASEMHCDADFIQGMKKGKGQTEFACMVRNVTARAVRMSVPLGVMERLPKMSLGKYEELLALNHKRVCDEEGARREPAEMPEGSNVFQLGEHTVI